MRSCCRSSSSAGPPRRRRRRAARAARRWPPAAPADGHRAMQLSETSIRRPVFATVLSLLLVLIGLVSASRLQLREYPNIDEPVVTVETRLTGASSEVI